jgi:hypothetical protein
MIASIHWRWGQDELSRLSEHHLFAADKNNKTS